MKHASKFILVFVFTFLIYFAVSTRFTFHPRWAIDYFNPMAHALLQGRLDIPSPAETYDLVHFQGKWFTVWGVLPSLFLIPAQLLKGRYIPPIYLSILFGSLNVAIFFLLLRRLKKEFFPWLKPADVAVLLIFFAFGTTLFYVSTLGSVWHVSQIVSSFFGNLGIYFIVKKHRKIRDYFFSSFVISLSFLGRVTTVFLIFLPVFFFLWDTYKKFSPIRRLEFFLRGFAVIGFPILLFLLLFLEFNILRFGKPMEFGYSYITEAPYLAAIRMKNGASSLRNIPDNFRYMVCEIPRITVLPRLELHPNLIGNSIFFLSPPLIFILAAWPLRKKKRWEVDPYVAGIWATVVCSLIPILMHYSTGWMQFGYRYTLDITMLLVILTVFAQKGRLVLLYYVGVLFSVIMYSWGILLMQ